MSNDIYNNDNIGKSVVLVTSDTPWYSKLVDNTNTHTYTRETSNNILRVIYEDFDVLSPVDWFNIGILVVILLLILYTLRRK